MIYFSLACIDQTRRICKEDKTMHIVKLWYTAIRFWYKLATTARFARLRCSLRLQGDIVDFMCIMVPAPKKIWSWPTFEGLEAAGGSWGGQRPSGTTRDQCCGQKEPFEPKKNFGLGRPLMASRPLEGPGGPDTVRDHQGSMLWSKGTI